MARTVKRRPPERVNGAETAATVAVWLETAAVLVVVAAPSIARVACWVVWGGDYLEYDKRFRDVQTATSRSFTIGVLESFFSHLRWVPIILFLMWRSGDTWARFGLVRPRWKKDILLGVGLSLILAVTGYVVQNVIRQRPSVPLGPLFPCRGPRRPHSPLPRVCLCDRLLGGTREPRLPHSTIRDADRRYRGRAWYLVSSSLVSCTSTKGLAALSIRTCRLAFGAADSA